jgi:hypothetical protein
MNRWGSILAAGVLLALAAAMFGVTAWKFKWD